VTALRQTGDGFEVQTGPARLRRRDAAYIANRIGAATGPVPGS
jgi:hypothetical protein